MRSTDEGWVARPMASDNFAKISFSCTSTAKCESQGEYRCALSSLGIGLYRASLAVADIDYHKLEDALPSVEGRERKDVRPARQQRLKRP